MKHRRIQLPEKPKIVFVSFHEEARYCIPALYENHYSISAIITLDEIALKKRSGVFDYHSQAQAFNIPIHCVTSINDADSLEILRDISPDLLLVFGWSQILSPEALNCAMLCVGAHASLLPMLRGSAPVNWAIIQGRATTGNTAIVLAEGVDTGEILSQREIAIDPVDSCGTIYDKVAQTNADMLVEILSKVERGELVATSQVIENDDIVLPRRRPEDGRINWNCSSREVYDFIRALADPYPGAFTYVNSKKIIVWKSSIRGAEFYSKAAPLETHAQQDAGCVLDTVFSHDPGNCGVVVACASGSVTIHEIEVDGRTRINGSALLDYFAGVSKLEH